MGVVAIQPLLRVMVDPEAVLQVGTVLLIKVVEQPDKDMLVGLDFFKAQEIFESPEEVGVLPKLVKVVVRARMEMEEMEYKII